MMASVYIVGMVGLGLLVAVAIEGLGHKIKEYYGGEQMP
jgi:hypothetical protein